MNSFKHRSFRRISNTSPPILQYHLDPRITKAVSEQLINIQDTPESSLPRRSLKLVDLRFTIDLILTRFNIILVVNQNQCKTLQSSLRLTRMVNSVIAMVLLLSLNLSISAFMFLAVYLMKSTLGIDLFPFHLKNLFGVF